MMITTQSKEQAFHRQTGIGNSRLEWKGEGTHQEPQHDVFNACAYLFDNTRAAALTLPVKGCVQNQLCRHAVSQSVSRSVCVCVCGRGCRSVT